MPAVESSGTIAPLRANTGSESLFTVIVREPGVSSLVSKFVQLPRGRYTLRWSPGS
jgi:hypothetical protein